MSRTIFVFIKMFECKEYAEDFLDGKLFFNRLSYFKGREDQESATRGDKYETVVDWRQPDKVKLTITHNGKSFDIDDLAGPFYAQANGLNNIHVFCLYAAHSGNLVEIEAKGDSLIRGHLHTPPELSKFGEYAVVVTETKAFIERVTAAIQGKNHWGSASLVDYYDPDTFSGEFSYRDAIFRKRKEFCYQSEYRFSFDTGISGEEPMILDIGSVRDIAYILPIDDIRASIKLEIKPVDES